MEREGKQRERERERERERKGRRRRVRGTRELERKAQEGTKEEDWLQKLVKTRGKAGRPMENTKEGPEENGARQDEKKMYWW